MSNIQEMCFPKLSFFNNIKAFEKDARGLWKIWVKELRNLHILARCFPVEDTLFNKLNTCSVPYSASIP